MDGFDEAKRDVQDFIDTMETTDSEARIVTAFRRASYVIENAGLNHVDESYLYEWLNYVFESEMHRVQGVS